MADKIFDAIVFARQLLDPGWKKLYLLTLRNFADEQCAINEAGWVGPRTKTVTNEDSLTVITVHDASAALLTKQTSEIGLLLKDVGVVCCGWETNSAAILTDLVIVAFVKEIATLKKVTRTYSDVSEYRAALQIKDIDFQPEMGNDNKSEMLEWALKGNLEEFRQLIKSMIPRLGPNFISDLDRNTFTLRCKCNTLRIVFSSA